MTGSDDSTRWQGDGESLHPIQAAFVDNFQLD